MRLLKSFLFLINIFCGLALILVFLSPYISPNTSYIPQLLALAGYEPWLGINILFILIWWWWHPSRAYLSIIACVPIFFFAPRLFHLLSNQTDNTDGKLSIMSYNVRMFTLKNSKDSIFHFLKKENTDIICFQEYNNTVYRKYGQNILKKKYPYSQVHKTKRETAIFSKYPIIHKKDIGFNKAHNCSGIQADIVVKKDTIRLLNIHLESNKISTNNEKQIKHIIDDRTLEYNILTSIKRKLFKASQRRVVQVKILEEIIKSSPYKVVLCGDFNNIPLSYTYQSIANHLKDSFKAGNYGKGTTFKKGKINVRIDYIFSPIEAESFQTYQVSYSDHFPIKAILPIKTSIKDISK